MPTKLTDLLPAPADKGRLVSLYFRVRYSRMHGRSYAYRFR